jgi:hypothetical protein
MTTTPHKAPWLLARCAQAAIAAAAVADLFRAVALRESHLHPTAANDLAAARASMILGNLMLLAAILFLLWLVRSRRIAEQVSPDAPLPGPGWTVGVWFVPVVNLFVPLRCVLQIGRASSAAWSGKRDGALVNAWWVTWVGHALLVGSLGQTAPGSLTVLVVAQALMSAAAVLAGLVIQRLTTIQAAASVTAHEPAASVTPA